jgi:acyl-CoA hydrolase|tara:strand:- start:100 stop:501 length:402 start_codon:yes stop_codon:yes gene_type:complete
MKTLVYKIYTGGATVNGHGSVYGGWLFDVLDKSGLVWINENITSKIGGVAAATSSATVKFHSAILPFGFIEAYAECSDISAGSITIDVDLYYRKNDSTKSEVAASGTLSFSLVDKDTRKLQRVSREIIDAIKG